MSRHNRSDKQPSLQGEKGQEKPARIKLSLVPPTFEIEGRLGFVTTSIIGFLCGSAIILAAVYYYGQPAIVVNPAISSAVSATITALPTVTPVPTPTRSLMFKLFDASTGMPLIPERDEYRLNPGQRVTIKVEPAREGRMYRWTATPKDKFEPSMPTEPLVTFIVPEKHDQLTVVTVCELSEDLSCPGGGERTVLIRATASGK